MSHEEVVDYRNQSKYSELLLKDEFRILQKKTGKKKVVQHDLKEVWKYKGANFHPLDRDRHIRENEIYGDIKTKHN
jgi:hypothetical protein